MPPLSRIGTVLSSALLTATLTACLFEGNNDIEKTPPGPYVIGITSQGEDGTDYVMTAASLTEGTISPTGRGIEQTGWRFMGSHGGVFFTGGYSQDNNFIGYVKSPDDSTRLVEKGRFTFPVTLDEFTETGAGQLLAVEIPRTGMVDRTFFRIDLNDVSIAATSTHEIWKNEADSLIAWPTALVHRDDRIFIPFYPIHGRGDFSTPQTDTAYVAVFGYPSLELEKIIKHPTGGALGIYAGGNGLIRTASDDLYAYSCASAACFTTDSTIAHSKVLRIRDGETEWDATYEWDFEAATGRKLTWFAPVGGELAIARVMTPENARVEWSAQAGGVIELYLLDLAARAAAPIEGAPQHLGEWSAKKLFVEDGKAYVNVTTETETRLYVVDIAAGTAVPGAKVVGQAVKMIAR